MLLDLDLTAVNLVLTDPPYGNVADADPAKGWRLASLVPFGRALPPCTDGSAHHLAARRRTAT